MQATTQYAANMQLYLSECVFLLVILPNRVNNYGCFNSLYFFLPVSSQFNSGCGVYCLHHTPAAAVPVEIKRRKSRGPFLRQQCATRLTVL